MIAFEVKLNGKRICIAGAEDLAVLTASVTAGGDLGRETVNHCAPHIHYSVGGLTARPDPTKDVHMRWKSIAPLRLGDTIEINVLEVPKADRPKSRTNAEKASRARMARKS
jgi:hypothetical protein